MILKLTNVLVADDQRLKSTQLSVPVLATGSTDRRNALTESFGVVFERAAVVAREVEPEAPTGELAIWLPNDLSGQCSCEAHRRVRQRDAVSLRR
jgi:hypothetical protein